MFMEIAASMADFLLYALLAGLALAVVAGPLGSFVVWRRMAYFGDTFPQLAWLGLALGFFLISARRLGLTAGGWVLHWFLWRFNDGSRLPFVWFLAVFDLGTLSL